MDKDSIYIQLEEMDLDELVELVASIIEHLNLSIEVKENERGRIYNVR